MRLFLLISFAALFTFANPFGDLSKKLQDAGNKLNEAAEQASKTQQDTADQTDPNKKLSTVEALKQKAEQVKDLKETAEDAQKAHKEFKEEQKDRDPANSKLNKAKDAVSLGKKSYDVGSKYKSRKDQRKKSDK